MKTSSTKRQKYPYWRPLEHGGGWAYYTRFRHYSATCMRTSKGQWRVPHLNYAGPFDELEDAKALVETIWDPQSETRLELIRGFYANEHKN